MAQRNLKELMQAYEKMILEQTLARNGGDRDATAGLLGISRRALDKKLLRHRIGSPRFAQALPIGRVDDDREA